MMSLEEYKRLNYKMVVQYNPDEKSYFVEFPELPGCMADAETAGNAVEKALRAKDEWLEVAVKSGYEIPMPVEKPETTGRQTVRMPKSLHARVIERAEEEGVSQNQLILAFIAEGLRRTESRDLSTKVIDACQEVIRQVSESKTYRPIVINAGGFRFMPPIVGVETAGLHYVKPQQDIKRFYDLTCTTTVAQSGTTEIQTVTGVLRGAGVCAIPHLVGASIGEREEATPLALAE